MKRILTVLTLVFALVGLAACDNTNGGGGNDDEKLVNDATKNVALNVAINYQGNNFITYNKDTPYVALNGKTYSKGDIMPIWEAIGENLNINFSNGSSSSDENTNAQFTRLVTEGFDGIDLVNGTGAGIAEQGVAGKFIDLNDYMYLMPNLEAFLTANPAIKQSMTSADGGVYFTPYFDGIGEIELMQVARIDWITDILDKENAPQGTVDFDSEAYTGSISYVKTNPNSMTDVKVTVANADGTTRVVSKTYAKNVIDVLKDLPNKTGKTMAEAFIAYMQDVYGDQGYASLADVFVGTDASYHVDEMIALMYVLKANPKYLTREHSDGIKSSVEVLYPRDKSGSRLLNLVRFGETFGIRGVMSRNEYFYYGTDGKLVDTRTQAKTLDMVDNLSNLYGDGLIVQNPELGFEGGGGSFRDNLVKKATGFMGFDFNASSTTTGYVSAATAIDSTFRNEAILPPVNDWLGDGNYFHFTESSRSLKSEAWGIPSTILDGANGKEKLARALVLVDYLYSTEGENLFVFGPKEWQDGTIMYNGVEIPKISDEAKAQRDSLAGGNMINYYRQYLGGTMPVGHIRTLGLEYQTLSDQGKTGIERINTAVNAGVFKLAGQTESTNPWFAQTPSVYALTKSESDQIALSATYRDVWSTEKVVLLVKYGFSGEGESLTRNEYMATMMYNNVNAYETIYLPAYERALDRVNGK